MIHTIFMKVTLLPLDPIMPSITVNPIREDECFICNYVYNSSHAKSHAYKAYHAYMGHDRRENTIISTLFFY